MHIVDKNGSKFESFLTRRKLAFLFKEKMLFADVHWVIHAFDSYEKNLFFKELGGYFMTFIVCVVSDSEEKGEGTLCDAYLNRHTSTRPKSADNNDSVLPIKRLSKQPER